MVLSKVGADEFEEGAWFRCVEAEDWGEVLLCVEGEAVFVDVAVEVDGKVGDAEYGFVKANEVCGGVCEDDATREAEIAI